VSHGSAVKRVSAPVSPALQPLALGQFPVGKAGGGGLVPAAAEGGLDQLGEIGWAQRLGLRGGRRVVAEAVKAALVRLLGRGRLQPSVSAFRGRRRRTS
jgi:hypothetical protein